MSGCDVSSPFSLVSLLLFHKGNFLSHIFSIRGSNNSESGVTKSCLIITTVCISAERHFLSLQRRTAAFWLRHRRLRQLGQH